MSSVPADVAREPFGEEARPREPMVLARIDHQLALHPERAEGLVHLLGVLKRHVVIEIPGHKERWRHDAIGVQERVRLAIT